MIGNFFKPSGPHSEFGSEIGAEPGHPMRPAFTAVDLDLDPYGTTDEDLYDMTLTPFGRLGPRAPWEPLP